jgi:hypothetical protein
LSYDQIHSPEGLDAAESKPDALRFELHGARFEGAPVQIESIGSRQILLPLPMKLIRGRHVTSPGNTWRVRLLAQRHQGGVQRSVQPPMR